MSSLRKPGKPRRRPPPRRRDDELELLRRQVAEAEAHAARYTWPSVRRHYAERAAWLRGRMDELLDDAEA